MFPSLDMKLDLVIQALNRKTMAHEHNCRNFLPVHNSCQPLQIQNPCNQPQFRAPYQQTPVQHHCIQTWIRNSGCQLRAHAHVQSQQTPVQRHCIHTWIRNSGCQLRAHAQTQNSQRFHKSIHTHATKVLLPCCRHCQPFGHQTYCRGLHSFPHFGLVPVARYIHTRRNTTQNHRPTKSAKLPIDHHSSPAIGHSTNSHHRPNLQQSSRSNPHSNFLKLHSTCPSFLFLCYL